MKTALDLKKAYEPTHTSFASKRLFSIIEEEVERSAQKGLSQAYLEVPRKLYHACDVIEIRKKLVGLGYKVMTGQISGLLTSNQLVEPRYTFRVIW